MLYLVRVIHKANELLRCHVVRSRHVKSEVTCCNVIGEGKLIGNSIGAREFKVAMRWYVNIKKGKGILTCNTIKKKVG